MANNKKMAGMYEGYKESKRQESRDGGMLSEDRSAVANLPQDVKYHAWGGNYVGLDASLDDTIRGIDNQQREDLSGAKRSLNPTKY